MSKKLAHSKIKNTGVLFEVLTRQVTADIIEGKDSNAIPLIKKHFHKNTSLGKELELYNILTTEKYKNRDKAENLVEAVIRGRQRLSNKVLRSEKYNLIKDIKENYDVKALFSTRMPNYKQLASIYRVFLYETTPNSIGPVEVVDSKEYVVECLTAYPSNTPIKSKLIEKFNSEEKDVKLLSYSLMVEKFNKKYSTLNVEQKEVLRKYINNVSNTNSFTEFIGEEVATIKKSLSNILPQVDDEITSIKLDEVINQADALLGGKKISEKKLVTLLRYYELIGELKNVSVKAKKLHS